MSYLTTIVLHCSHVDYNVCSDGSIEISDPLNALLKAIDELGFNGNLHNVTPHAGGGNVGAPLLVGTFKTSDSRALVGLFKALRWDLPEEVMLTVKGESEPFEIYFPT